MFFHVYKSVNIAETVFFFFKESKGRRVGEGIVRECGIDMYTLLYLKWITNKDLLYSTGNSAQYYITT